MLVKALWLVFFAAIIWKLIRVLGAMSNSAKVFQIKVEAPGEKGVAIEGRVASKLLADARVFVARLDLPVGSTIDGRRRSQGFALAFSSEVTADARQKLSRYLHVDD